MLQYIIDILSIVSLQKNIYYILKEIMNQHQILFIHIYVFKLLAFKKNIYVSFV